MTDRQVRVGMGGSGGGTKPGKIPAKAETHRERGRQATRRRSNSREENRNAPVSSDQNGWILDLGEVRSTQLGSGVTKMIGRRRGS